MVNEISLKIIGTLFYGVSVGILLKHYFINSEIGSLIISGFFLLTSLIFLFHDEK